MRISELVPAWPPIAWCSIQAVRNPSDAAYTAAVESRRAGTDDRDVENPFRCTDGDAERRTDLRPGGLNQDPAIEHHRHGKATVAHAGGSQQRVCFDGPGLDEPERHAVAAEHVAKVVRDRIPALAD